jgi:hypothetical protein
MLFICWYYHTTGYNKIWVNYYQGSSILCLLVLLKVFHQLIVWLLSPFQFSSACIFLQLFSAFSFSEGWGVWFVVQHCWYLRLYSVEWWDDWWTLIGKNFKISSCSLIKALTLYLPGGSEGKKTMNNFRQDSQCADRDRTQHLLNTSVECYCYSNLLHVMSMLNGSLVTVTWLEEMASRYGGQLRICWISSCG